jgi:hypothetical protein
MLFFRVIETVIVKLAVEATERLSAMNVTTTEAAVHDNRQFSFRV